MNKKLIVSASLLAKSQVASYTRSDGVVVQAHDNGRQAAAPEPVNQKVLAKLKTSHHMDARALKSSLGSSLSSGDTEGHDGKPMTYGDVKGHLNTMRMQLGSKPEHAEHLKHAQYALNQSFGLNHAPVSEKHAKLIGAALSGKTRMDDNGVVQHAGGAAAPKPAAGGGGYSVAAFKHGGHQIKEPDGTHHVILQDKGVADRHAGALNHVATSGKDAHMNEAVHAAAKKHLHLDSFDEVGRDSEDFVDTGKGGLKAALHHAYDAGAGHSKGGTHRDTVVAEAAKHFAGFDSLEQEGRDHLDFKETSKGLLKHALKHAYASGAQKAQAKPASKLAVRASVAKKAAAKTGSAAPAHTPNPHHSDLEEGDELLDEKGQKHEYSATHRGIGRMQVEMRSGHKVPTGSDGKLDGWEKTGRNNITGAGHKPL